LRSYVRTNDPHFYRRRTIIRALRFIFVISLLIATPAIGKTAVTIEGVAFEKTYRIAESELHLRGTALLHYLVFIKAYVGAFYMLPQENAGRALGPTPRRLELAYFHAIRAADFADATRQKIADNVTTETLGAIAERLERFNGFYRDVQPGDRYALTYLPGRGTELSLNGEPLGRIAGEDFAAAVFAIWLGPSPIDEGFRDALLGIR
jgi:hypothetical protein